jgi:hypothetical protein
LKSNQTKLQVDHHQSYKDELDELEEIVKTRYASLQIGGRFQTPFEEWREQGAWEWFSFQIFMQNTCQINSAF